MFYSLENPVKASKEGLGHLFLPSSKEPCLAKFQQKVR